MVWQDIKTAPKDGTEFLTCNCNQGKVLELVNWNKIYGHWQSKGKAISMQATHWLRIPKIMDASVFCDGLEVWRKI